MYKFVFTHLPIIKTLYLRFLFDNNSTIRIIDRAIGNEVGCNILEISIMEIIFGFLFVLGFVLYTLWLVS